jgi:hypothetical protein
MCVNVGIFSVHEEEVAIKKYFLGFTSVDCYRALQLVCECETVVPESSRRPFCASYTCRSVNCLKLIESVENNSSVASILIEVIGYFELTNRSSRTVALGSTQPLTEMSTRNLPGRRVRLAT